MPRRTRTPKEEAKDDKPVLPVPTLIKEGDREELPDGKVKTYHANGIVSIDS